MSKASSSPATKADISNLYEIMIARFDQLEKKMDKQISDLANDVHDGFLMIDTRFNRLEAKDKNSRNTKDQIFPW